jgi:transposase-like protein
MSGQDEREEKDGGQRGRPGRRSLQDRQNAVLEVLQGKAPIHQIAPCLGVRPETVAGWRDAALAGMESARMRGDGCSKRERELERENDTLRDALTRSAIQVELLQRPHQRRPCLGAGVWPPRCGARRVELRTDHAPSTPAATPKSSPRPGASRTPSLWSGAPLGTPLLSARSAPCTRGASGWPTGATLTSWWPLSIGGRAPSTRTAPTRPSGGRRPPSEAAACWGPPSGEQHEEHLLMLCSAP